MFRDRHIGPRTRDCRDMLQALNLPSLDALIEATVPKSIAQRAALDLPKAFSENELLQEAWRLASKNHVFKSYIGQGYYGCHTPSVILRNVLENPDWYTAYTPYQAEISQGRMEALLNFQTMVADLTGMALSNSSLLDEGTAAAEAMSLCQAISKNKKSKKVFLGENVFESTRKVIETRARPLDIEVVIGDETTFEPSTEYSACIIQYPDARGEVRDPSALFERCHQHGLATVVATDLLSLCLLKPPGELGADVVVGSSQRFGVPFGFGGPHAAFLATKDEFKRQIPGRIIGVSKDASGQPALRLALQTREQHIRREKATSNICTAQVLLAVMASMYAVYHGPEGLRDIATRVHRMTQLLMNRLKTAGFEIRSKDVFDTFQIHAAADKITALHKAAQAKQVNFARISDTCLGLSLDETTTLANLETLLEIFTGKVVSLNESDLSASLDRLPEGLKRTSAYLTHPTFNRYRSETEMLRYIHRLQAKDLSLVHAMIPLGSCTMKLNATTEMIPITWPEFSNIHPLAPLEQAKGYVELIHQLEKWLAELTGFAGVSLQPNAGSQGEYSGLLTIRAYLNSKGESQRNICLIPSSAHGTNPASAVMAGFQVVVVKCDSQGNVDLTDLKAKAEEHKNDLAVLMITYPSTHGVFEESLPQIIELIHSHGGQVYMDGANLNAMVGVCQPGKIGVDVSHLNLHKTFCIPHGGGGPGVGPIGVANHLLPFLPNHSLVKEAGPATGIGPVTSSPWGSAGILPISWAYIAMMGGEGLKLATEVAILNANYIAKKLEGHYDVLYKGREGFVAHECIIDLRPLKETSGVTVDDVAKRLMDYGFHAPTMSWPVPGTLMIEPTESESKEELDRFIEAMIAIREEIRAIEKGQMDRDDNLLKHAPHSYFELLKDEWPHSYPRSQAAFPLDWVREKKFWVPVSRVDNVYGDKNLFCSCPPLDSY